MFVLLGSLALPHLTYAVLAAIAFLPWVFLETTTPEPDDGGDLPSDQASRLDRIADALVPRIADRLSDHYRSNQGDDPDDFGAPTPDQNDAGDGDGPSPDGDTPDGDKGEPGDALSRMMEGAFSRAFEHFAADRRIFPAHRRGAVPGYGGGRAPNINRYGVGGSDGFSFTRAIKYLAYGRDERQLRPPERKALATSPDASGGFLVPTEEASELIELIRARAIVAASGATERTMTSKILEIPKQTGGATAEYLGEGASGTPADQTFGQLQLTAKKLRAETVISMELLGDSNPDVEAIVREDLVRVSALREDLAFLRGSAANEPEGIENVSGVQSYTLENDTGDGATPTYDDLVNIQNLLATADAQEPGVWYFHPRTLATLRKIKDADGRPLWPAAGNLEAGQSNMLLGNRFFTTSQIPVNLTKGASNAASLIFYGVPSELVIARRQQIRLMASEHANWNTDQVNIKAISRHDFGIRTPDQWIVADGALA